MLFPLLAALRALLHYPNEVAEWRTPPVAFFEEYGADLVGRLFDEYACLIRAQDSINHKVTAIHYQGQPARLPEFRRRQKPRLSAALGYR
jgi:hypothetical protein